MTAERFEDVNAVDSGIRCEVVGALGDGYGRIRSFPVAKGSLTEAKILFAETELAARLAWLEVDRPLGSLDEAHRKQAASDEAAAAVRNHPDYKGGANA